MTETLLCLMANFLCLYLSQTSSHLSVCSLSGSAEVQVVHTFNDGVIFVIYTLSQILTRWLAIFVIFLSGSVVTIFFDAN